MGKKKVKKKKSKTDITVVSKEVVSALAPSTAHSEGPQLIAEEQLQAVQDIVSTDVTGSHQADSATSFSSAVGATVALDESLVSPAKRDVEERVTESGTSSKSDNDSDSDDGEDLEEQELLGVEASDIGRGKASTGVALRLWEVTGAFIRTATSVASRASEMSSQSLTRENFATLSQAGAALMGKVPKAGELYDATLSVYEGTLSSVAALDGRSLEEVTEADKSLFTTLLRSIKGDEDGIHKILSTGQLRVIDLTMLTQSDVDLLKDHTNAITHITVDEKSAELLFDNIRNFSTQIREVHLVGFENDKFKDLIVDLQSFFQNNSSRKIKILDFSKCVLEIGDISHIARLINDKPFVREIILPESLVLGLRELNILSDVLQKNSYIQNFDYSFEPEKESLKVNDKIQQILGGNKNTDSKIYNATARACGTVTSAFRGG